MKFRNKVLSLLFTSRKKKVKLKKKEAPAKKMKVKMRVKSVDSPAAQEKAAVQPGEAVWTEPAARVEEAVSSLAQAKAMHDDLEAVYNPHVDFDLVDRIAQDIRSDIRSF